MSAAAFGAFLQGRQQRRAKQMQAPISAVTLTTSEIRAMICRKDVVGSVAFAVMTPLISAGAVAAPSKVTMERCAQYAEKAVQEYNLMNSNPQCHVEPALRWQPNYDNHYNGCLLLPEAMVNSEETIRVTHLKACGAITDATAPAPVQPGSPSPAAAAPPVAATSVSAVPPSTPTAGAPTTGPNCRPDSSGAAMAVLNREKRTAMHGGTSYVLTGGTLTYTERDSKKRVTYAISRPSYYINMMNCAHQQVGNYGFGWVWVSPDGREGRVFTLATDDTLTWFTISGAGARELLEPL